MSNGSGELHSIDVPGATYLTDSREVWTDVSTSSGTGWKVPHAIRDRWHLHLGSSKLILPGLLKLTPEIDVFYHDTEHTYSSMAFEMDLAERHLSRRRILAVDNVNWSSAFPEFVRQSSW